MTHTYTIEPGRNIYRDGRPFVYVTYHVNRLNSERSCQPNEADDFARAIPEIIEAARDLVEQVDNYANSDEADLPGADRLALALSKVGV